MNSQKPSFTIWKPKKIAKTEKSEFVEKFIIAHTCFGFQLIFGVTKVIKMQNQMC